MQALAFSPDGRVIASGGDGIEVWDTRSARRLFRSEIPLAAKDLAFSPDGTKLAVADAEGGITLFHVRTGRQVRRWRASNHYCFAVAYSRDREEIVTGGDYDGSLKFWNAATGALLRRVKEHNGAVSSIEFSADGRRLATGSLDRTARIWDAKSRKVLRVLSGRHVNVWSIAFSGNGRTLLTAGSRQIVWNAETGERIQMVAQRGSHLAVSFDGRTGYREDGNRVRVWPIPKSRAPGVIAGRRGPPSWTVAASPR